MTGELILALTIALVFLLWRGWVARTRGREDREMKLLVARGKANAR